MEEIAKIVKKFNVKSIPKLTPEEIKKHDRELEERLVMEYRENKAKTFLKKRSLYSEKGVLDHTFSQVEPVSDMFVQLAKKARGIASEYAKGQRFHTILAGQAGAGKTMLAVCIINWCFKKSIEPVNCLFVSVSELADLVYSQYRKEEHERQARYHQLFKDIKDCDLLVLDDLGSESSMQYSSQEASNTIQKALFRIGDLMQGKALIITTNNSEEQLVEIYNDKIVSRLLTDNDDHILNFENVSDYRRAHN